MFHRKNHVFFSPKPGALQEEAEERIQRQLRAETCLLHLLLFLLLWRISPGYITIMSSSQSALRTHVSPTVTRQCGSSTTRADVTGLLWGPVYATLENCIPGSHDCRTEPRGLEK